MPRRREILSTAAAALAMLVRPARASGFPDHPITLIAPFAAGGSSDVLARATAQGMGERLGQAIIVDNRAGAGGTLGLGQVARATANGYTLGFGGVGSLVYSAGMYAGRLSFDVRKDFTLIGLMGSTPAVIVAGRASGIKSLSDVVTMAKQSPGTITYGSPGIGSALHLAAEMFQRLAKVSLVHVPYRGAAPALTDVLGGHVSLGFIDAATIMGQRSNPDLQILAVAGKARMKQLPDVPTTAELGFPELDVQVWYGVVAPAGVPTDVAERLEHASQEVATSAVFQALLLESGYAPFPGGKTEFANLIAHELQVWLPIIKDANITLQ